MPTYLMRLGKKVGTATLTVDGSELHITANLFGLPPGMHALHVHTVGRCEGPISCQLYICA